MDFYSEIVVATLSEDCPAALAWVEQMVADNIAVGNADALAAIARYAPQQPEASTAAKKTA